MPSSADVTVVVAPRESYLREPSTLRHLLAETAPDAQVIVVHDDRCPRGVERSVVALERSGRLRHVHLGGRAGANACRAAGLVEVTTPYVLFLDNDARLERGAVERLVALAREVGASFVSPICLNGDGTVHYAGSVVRFTGVDGRRQLVELHLHQPGRTRAAELRPHLEAAPTDAPELHAVLVDTALIRAAGGLDEELWSSMDCLDLGLRLQDAGGGGWLEPAAAVEYAGARPALRDLPIYFDRWSRATIEHDLDRFVGSWDLDPSSPRVADHRRMLGGSRWRPLRLVRGGLRRTLGQRAVAAFDRTVDPMIDRWSAS